MNSTKAYDRDRDGMENLDPYERQLTRLHNAQDATARKAMETLTEEGVDQIAHDTLFQLGTVHENVVFPQTFLDDLQEVDDAVSPKETPAV